MVWRMKTIANLHPGYGLTHETITNLYAGYGLAYENRCQSIHAQGMVWWVGWLNCYTGPGSTNTVYLFCLSIIANIHSLFPSFYH